MPDTGAPWNIPYVEAADLVSDWPADSLALANAIDAGLDAAGNAGIGSNVVESFTTTSFTVSSSTLVTTGRSVVITPSSATSKILVIGIAYSGRISATGPFFSIAADRGGTVITPESKATSSNLNNRVPLSFTFLDSPGSASAQTYTLMAAVAAGSAVFDEGLCLICIEVAA